MYFPNHGYTHPHQSTLDAFLMMQSALIDPMYDLFERQTPKTCVSHRHHRTGKVVWGESRRRGELHVSVLHTRTFAPRVACPPATPAKGATGTTEVHDNRLRTSVIRFCR